MKYNLGELVKYYEFIDKLYDNTRTIKKAGYGLITAFNIYTYGDEISKVYTLLAHGKKHHFEEYQIEKTGAQMAITFVGMSGRSSGIVRGFQLVDSDLTNNLIDKN